MAEFNRFFSLQKVSKGSLAVASAALKPRPTSMAVA
jgi:hypothetical protein